jgi:putative acetyltransferase
VRVREEEQRDRESVHALNVAAFETSAEADLVDALREQARPVLSLVAEEAARIVGHVLFTPVSLSGHADRRIMGLAPMAVAPERQRKGIGSALVRAGLERCRDLGFGAGMVLGHPSFYPRFGFQPAARFGVACEYDAPAEAFMLVELVPGYLRGASGTVQFHPAFENA